MKPQELHNPRLEDKRIEGKIELPEFIDFEERKDSDSQTAESLKRKLMSRYGLKWPQADRYVEYDRKLGPNLLKTISGKSVLDVGSGPGNFKSAIIKINPGPVKIVNLDEGVIWRKTMDVVGEAADLPFRDNGFDVVLARCSVPIMDVQNEGRFDLIPGTLRELLRVVKINGVVKISPIGGDSKDRLPVDQKRYEKMFQEIIKEVSNIHKENPDWRIKVTKIISQDDFSYFYSLEIRK